MYTYRYQVIGQSNVLGHEPGEIFEHDFDGPNPLQEQQLIQGGHIRKLPQPQAPIVPRLDDPQPTAEEE